MAEPSGRSLQVSTEAQAKANIALSKFGSKAGLAAALGMSRTTINKFFKGEPVQVKNFHAICKKLKFDWQPEPVKSLQPKSADFDVDELVREVRSRGQADIQRLHGTMPLWGVDHWVPLGELFVDVNILEEVSGSRRSELDDLWQDFSRNPGYRSLERIGLGKQQQRVSGLQALEKGSHLMVLGKPGSGKTTYLQRIVTECNAGTIQVQRIPALIKLREFIDDGECFQYSLEQYFAHHWKLSDADATLIFSQGRSLILLDGLDEVTGEKGKQISRQIQQFARTYPHNQLVVTCRTQSQESRFERFDYVEVADFDEAQVRAFAEHWFTAIANDESVGLEQAQAFLEQLFRDENKTIRELAITPILLSLTCAVFHQTGKFYSKRSKLYEEGLELLLETWDKSREIERDQIYRDLSVERKLELLSYLALKKFEQPQYVLFEQAELEGYIAEFLGIGQRESRSVLKAISSQHGLLIERAQKVWSFSHLTFQEYFTARQIKKHQCKFQKLVGRITDKHWKEVFFLTLEMLSNADDLLRMMKAKADQILASDEKLQRFLVWLDQKSRSVKSPYMHSAVRAFYLQFNQTDVLGYDFDCHGLESDIDVFLAKDLIYSLERKCILSQELALDQAFNSVFENAIWYSREPVAGEIGEIDDAFDFLRFCARECDIDLKSKLIDLQDQLWSFRSSRYTFEQAWKNNGLNWTKQLRSVILEHRNIRYDWQFNNIQKEKLRQYYNANKLLINCLNSNNYTSRSVRKEIEETLLLPIAEIEKRRKIE